VILRSTPSARIILPKAASLCLLEQLGDLHRERLGHTLDVDEADVAGSPLDVREVRAVDARPLGELLLRQPEGLAPVLDREAEPLADV